MRKLLLSVFAVLLSCSAWAEDVEIDGVKFSLNEETKEASVISKIPKYSGEVVVPSSVTRLNVIYSVTNIHNNAFLECADLTSIKIPNSVTSIGWLAFSGCTGLNLIEIPNSVTNIGVWAFFGCSGLTSIEIPSSVTSIGENAFGGCTGLTSIIVSTGNSVYDSRNNCNAIIATESNTLISGCQNTIIPSSVTSIGDYAFRSCTSLTSIEIPNSVTSIGSSAFYGCTGLTSIKIPNSVNSIGSSTFGGCTGLTSVEIPNSVTSIGDWAFSGCTGLTSIDIPKGVTSIGDWAFSDCTGLTSIEIPNSVTSIGGSTFSDCTGLTSIVIPNSVTSIVSNAFKGCTNLTSVTINSNTIVSRPYSSSSNIGTIFGNQVTEYIIGNDVTSIGNDAFSGCSGLTSIEIPNSVISIGLNAFYNTAWYDNLPDGLVYVGKVAYKYKGTMPENTSIIINEGTTEITAYAFNKCTGLASIEIPNSVTNIGMSAFEGCTRLTEVGIGKGLTSIGENAFKDCSSLTSVTINNNSIVSKSYSSSSNIGTIFGNQVTEYIIGDDVNSIGNYAFTNCSGFTSIEIPNSVTSIGNCAFESCTGLTSINIPNSVTSIGGYAFSGCTGLTSIEFPNNVAYIGNLAFSSCSALTRITIGSGIENINSKAFANCKKLEDVYCYAARYPTTKDDTFDNSYIEFVTLHVPEKSINQYKSKTPWSGFMDVVAIGNEGEEYYLAIRIGDGGVLLQPVELGKTYTYKVEPDEGWTVNTLTFNGEDMTSKLLDGQFSTPVITGDAELNVVFKQEASNIKSMKQTETSKVKVYAYNGTVKVAGAEDGAEIEVYNAGGILVANGEGNCSISLDSGIYIVKVGNETFKVSL